MSSTHYITAGRLAVELQMRPAQIDRIAADLGIAPDLALNDLRYFSEYSAQLIELAARERGLIPGNFPTIHQHPRAGGVDAAAVSVG